MRKHNHDVIMLFSLSSICHHLCLFRKFLCQSSDSVSEGEVMIKDNNTCKLDGSAVGNKKSPAHPWCRHTGAGLCVHPDQRHWHSPLGSRGASRSPCFLPTRLTAAGVRHHLYPPPRLPHYPAVGPTLPPNLQSLPNGAVSICGSPGPPGAPRAAEGDGLWLSARWRPPGAGGFAPSWSA